MKLFLQILRKILATEEIQLVFPNLQNGIQTLDENQIDATMLVDLKSYQALRKIKAIVEDNHLDDRECFMRIEEIINVLEEIGSDGGNRHDFG